uniref:hypothetical protein n=1 Tax=Pseudonocardia sp. CA-138482 TaxID=3240023 RepID=UPI003F4908FB
MDGQAGDQLRAHERRGVPYKALRRLKAALTTGRRIPNRWYPDIPYTYHRFAKTYGWTPGQVDQLDVDIHDWLLAIQALESEIEADERKKAERAMRAQAQRRG